jgi:hypothetical protein
VAAESARGGLPAIDAAGLSFRRVAMAWGASLLLTLPAWLCGDVFSSDQALFITMAEAIRDGQRLYLDVWDNKQPGIVWLYAAAGGVFGEGWEGLRIPYSLWLATAATLLSASLMVALPGSRVWWVGPVLTLGLTMLRTNPEQVAQVEEMVALPIAAIVLLCVLPDRASRASTTRWLAIGLATLVLAVLKIALAPIAAAVIAVTLALRVRWGMLSLGAATVALVTSLVGFALGAIPVIGYFAATGAMAEFLWTQFTYPGLALAQVEPASPSRLLASLGWLLKSTAPLLLVAALGAGLALRRRGSPAGLLGAAAVAWLVVSLGMILAQKFSWWAYHMVMPIWPIGLLAALALGLLPASEPIGSIDVRRWSPLVVVVVGGWMAFQTAYFIRKIGWADDWPLSSDAIESRETARALGADPGNVCRTVYVFGDPIGLQRRTGLRQAIPTHGIFWGAFLPAQAERLPEELRAARPDLVYVDGDQRAFFERRHAAATSRLDAWLTTDYQVRARDAQGGVWWQRSAPRSAGDCPAPARFIIPPATVPTAR